MIIVDVDHSQCLGPARHQGMRPTCLAFTASDLNASSHATGHLSVEFLCHHAAQLTHNWQPGQGFTMEQVMKALAVPGQPLEEQYPYRPDDHAAPLAPPIGDFSSLYASTLQDRFSDVERVIESVRSGRHVGVAVAVTQSLFYPVGGIVQFDPMAVPDQYHAMVAVGVGKHAFSDEPHVLVRNSWGPGWGSNGHAWVSLEHLRLHLVEAFLL